MTYSLKPPYADRASERLYRLDGLIAAAEADIVAADAAVAAVSADIETIEPHPHAHGHTAGEDCAYAGIGAEHFLPLAGLLAQPWREALGTVVTIQQQCRFDYLLKAFPAAMAVIGDTLIDDGADVLDSRSDRLDQDLRELFARKPVVALGLVWRIFGFHSRDRDAWVGAFAYRSSLSELIGSNDDLADDMSLGDALAATVASHHTFLTEVGARELHCRAERRDAERQASWAKVPETYREAGSWRSRSLTKRQWHLMQRIEAVRCLPIVSNGRRGDTSDRITRAGGNPRFAAAGEVKS